MNYISHRGNLEGPIVELENQPGYIDEAIQQNYMVEVDLWVLEDKLLLGHDGPQYLIDFNWLKERKEFLWIHCKNTEAFDMMLKENLHCFFHKEDSYTMTSWGYSWSYPGCSPAGPLCVQVMPEKVISIENFKKDKAFHAICSDYVKLLNRL